MCLRTAGLQNIVAHDPFDQALSAALAPAVVPLWTYIGRTPTLSNLLVALLGNDAPLVSRLFCLSFKPFATAGM